MKQRASHKFYVIDGINIYYLFYKKTRSINFTKNIIFNKMNVLTIINKSIIT